MTSGTERRPQGSRNESTLHQILGSESLAFSSRDSVWLFPLWKRLLWLVILCLLIVTCLVGILVLAFSHFRNSNVRTTQIRTGALLGFGFLLAAGVAWSVFVYVKLGRPCAPRTRGDRRRGFRALGSSLLPPTPSSRSRQQRPVGLQPVASSRRPAVVQTRRLNGTERNLGPADGSIFHTNNNGNVPIVGRCDGVRVANGRFVLAREVFPSGSRAPAEVPRGLTDNRRNLRHAIQSPTQLLPSMYCPVSLQQGYINHGIVRNSATALPPPNTTSEISRSAHAHFDHLQLDSHPLDGGDRSRVPPPPYRPQDHISPPPAYDAIHLTRRSRIYSEASNPPPYHSAPSSPVLSRQGERMPRAWTMSCSPLLTGREENSACNEDCSSFAGNFQTNLPHDGDVFACETSSSLQSRSFSPLAQESRIDACVLSMERVHYPGIPPPSGGAANGSDGRFLVGAAHASVSLEYAESLQLADDFSQTAPSAGSSERLPPGQVIEGISNGPVIYVYLGRTEQG